MEAKIKLAKDRNRKLAERNEAQSKDLKRENEKGIILHKSCSARAVDPTLQIKP